MAGHDDPLEREENRLHRQELREFHLEYREDMRELREESRTQMLALMRILGHFKGGGRARPARSPRRLPSGPAGPP